MILEDSSTIPDAYQGSRDYYLRNAVMTPKLDPVPLVGYLASVTKHIGIAPTLTTTFYPPFLLARLLSTLDHFTDGRIGWNIVTATNDRAGQNYGLPGQPEHDLRYDMADEFIDCVTGLWESWEEGAMVMDDATGVFADPSKVHTVDFEGRFYKSRGPLNVPRSPQGRPVFVAPGASPRGRRFSGRNAEIVLAGHAGKLHEMKDYRDEVRRHAAAFGRNPDTCKVLFICNPFITRTKQEAEELEAEMAQARIARLERQLAAYSYMANVDLSKIDIDAPVPAMKINGLQSMLRNIESAGPNASLRDVMVGTYNFTPIGTADAVAAQMAEAMEEIGGDGFLVAGLIKPKYVQSIAGELVPALQRRKLTRTRYDGSTLRERLQAF
jgi:FMN-dependent oxidoreductase (nitrilotriacetate monooxygenase family)